MNSKRVLVVLGTNAGWSRGILRGFMAAAHEHDWTLLHYDPPTSLDWIVHEAISRLASAALVSVTVDRTANGGATTPTNALPARPTARLWHPPQPTLGRD